MCIRDSNISPLGSISSFCTGAIHGGFFSLIAFYATKANFTLLETSILLFISTISGVLGQWPIGYISDKYDRRIIIVITTFLAAILAFFSILTSNDPIENMFKGMTSYAENPNYTNLLTSVYNDRIKPIIETENMLIPKRKPMDQQMNLTQ